MEIDKNPQVPKLNDQAIKLLTDLCFRSDDIIHKVDGIFIFSSTHEIPQLAAIIDQLLVDHVAEKIFITGGVTKALLAKGLTDTTEADLLLSHLDIDKFPQVDFFIERESTNTMENVTFTLANSDLASCKKLLFIFKCHAAGRGYLTLKKYLPNTELLQKTFAAKYTDDSSLITKDNWFKSDFAISRVWGEFLRIKTYGIRGDIAYESVKDLVADIEYIIYQ